MKDVRGHMSLWKPEKFDITGLQVVLGEVLEVRLEDKARNGDELSFVCT